MQALRRLSRTLIAARELLRTARAPGVESQAQSAQEEVQPQVQPQEANIVITVPLVAWASSAVVAVGPDGTQAMALFIVRVQVVVVGKNFKTEKVIPPPKVWAEVDKVH